MKIILYVPHYGWGSGLITQMPKDTFYIVNKIEPGEGRGGDLCVSGEGDEKYWTWLRSIKPKPTNAVLLGKSWSEIDTDDYDVAILIADANQMRLWKYLKNIPVVWKFHLKNSGVKAHFHDIYKKTGKYPTDPYPMIFSVESQKKWYNFGKGYVITGSKNPNLYTGWIGDYEQVMWTCERIGNPNDPLPNARWNERGGAFWTAVKKADPSLPLVRYGLDFKLGTTITPFEKLLVALRHNRVYFEAAQNTLLTDGLMEAMMTGMPAIVYPANEMDRIIENEVNGFKTDDPKKVVEYTRRLLNDYDLAKAYGKKARETALKAWNPKKTERVHHLIFEEAMDIFNKEKGTKKTFHITGPPSPSRMDVFFSEALKKRIRELEVEAKAVIGWFRCPICGKRFKVKHHHGTHLMWDYWEHVKRGEKRLLLAQPRPSELLKPESIQVTEGIAESKRPCPNCTSNKIKKVAGNSAVCLGCSRVLGKWEDWVK